MTITKNRDTGNPALISKVLYGEETTKALVKKYESVINI